jgi:hypothetical protein
MKYTFTLTFALLLAPHVALRADGRALATMKLDVIYKTTGQGPLKPDLHHPAAPKAGTKYPLVLFTHGGGWAAVNKTIGDRGVRFPGVSALNAQGFCVASVEVLIIEKSAHNWKETGGALKPSLDEIVKTTAAFMNQHLDPSLKK